VSAIGKTAIRLAYAAVSILYAQSRETEGWATNIFDIWARMDGDHVAVLDAQVVADYAVDAGAAIIEIVVGQDN